MSYDCISPPSPPSLTEASSPALGVVEDLTSPDAEDYSCIHQGEQLSTEDGIGLVTEDDIPLATEELL